MARMTQRLTTFGVEPVLGMIRQAADVVDVDRGRHDLAAGAQRVLSQERLTEALPAARLDHLAVNLVAASRIGQALGTTGVVAYRSMLRG